MCASQEVRAGSERGRAAVAGRGATLDRRAFVWMLAPLLTGCVAERAPVGAGGDAGVSPASSTATAAVPAPSGADTLLDAIRERRSVRLFGERAVSEQHIALLCWAAQAVTDAAKGGRAAPSAGATYPLELYVASTEGVRRYRPKRDELERVTPVDVRRALATAAHGQAFIAEAPVVFVLAGVYARTERRYADRAQRYVHLEAGHAAQNLVLVATRLGLGAVTVGAFRDNEVRATMDGKPEETPLYVIPVGHPR